MSRERRTAGGSPARGSVKLGEISAGLGDPPLPKCVWGSLILGQQADLVKAPRRRREHPGSIPGLSTKFRTAGAVMKRAKVGALTVDTCVGRLDSRGERRAMRCKREGCYTEVPKRLQSTQVYCSAACAPLARRYAGSGTESTRKAASGSRVRGDGSDQYADARQQTANGTFRLVGKIPSAEETERAGRVIDIVIKQELERSGRGSLPSSGPDTTPEEWPEPRPTESASADTSGPGTPETQPSTPPESSEESTSLIPSEDSTPLLQRVERAHSDSLSLLVSSEKELHGLMTTVVQSAKNQMESHHADVQRVNAACNCAAQLTKMMRLKLDIFKAMKG